MAVALSRLWAPDPAPCNGIRIPEFLKFLLVESGILLRIGIQNASSTDKDWNLVPEIRNPRMSWFSLHGTKLRNTCEIFVLFLHSYKYLFQGFFVAVLFPTDGLYCRSNFTIANFFIIWKISDKISQQR